jgi:hypothetical protein
MNGNTSFEQEIAVQDELGQLIVLKKDGIDSGCYPLLEDTGPWTIGQNKDCDLRVRVSYLFCLFTSSIYNILSFLG